MSTNAVDWKALEELHAKATAGEWRWHLSHDGLSLRTPDRGQLIVMDVGRTGDIRFAKRKDKDRGGLLCDPKEFLPQPMRVGFCELDNPDAKLIPALRNAFPAILAERAALIAERDAAREALQRIADDRYMDRKTVMMPPDEHDWKTANDARMFLQRIARTALEGGRRE